MAVHVHPRQNQTTGVVRMEPDHATKPAFTASHSLHMVERHIIVFVSLVVITIITANIGTIRSA